MEDKTLSQKICEECGIEPKGKLIFKKRGWDGKTWLSVGVGYKKFDFESTPNVRVNIIPTKLYDEKNGFEYPYSMIEEIKKLYDKNGYDFIEFEAKFIDFENNNNFVKLLELKILTGCTLWGFLSLKGVYMSQKENVLKTIYLILSNKIKFLDDNSREQIKQAIREADWEV